MLNTPRSRRGMVTSPHHLASEAGLSVLREDGNAIEAAVAIAASLAVVYPHMTSIGGDGFWLIAPAGQAPIAIDGCGGAATAASPGFYHARGLDAVPWRGPLAANTVAGAVGGWGEALRLSAELGGRMPLSRILEDAIWCAEYGFPVTASQNELTAAKLQEIKDAPNFANSFLREGAAPPEGAIMRLPVLAETLRRIGRDGSSTFYAGALARDIADDLARCGSPLALADLAAFTSQRRRPLNVHVSGAELFNFAPPTQGLASLMILGLFDRLGVRDGESFEHIHGLIEATKQAFLVRDKVIGCPSAMRENAEAFLMDETLDALAQNINREHALDWPRPTERGDTVWLGAIDKDGLAVSFIQSIYFEFGSGCVLENTGIVWQNRGASFVLSGDGPRLIAPGRKPFHTLNPAMAFFDDGRRMVYGTMGGEGQPQTQAALFSRYAFFGQGLQAAVTAPRWLLGKTWGENSVTIKIENRFDPELISALMKGGHDIEILPAFTSIMGHAGAIVRHANGMLEGASDPRSDGAAMGF